MINIYLTQLIGVILSLGGILALMASLQIFGARLSPAEKRRASDEWNRRRETRRLPISLETIISILMLSSGVALLLWSKFNLCTFLAYWLPPLPEIVRLFLSCQ